MSLQPAQQEQLRKIMEKEMAIIAALRDCVAQLDVLISEMANSRLDVILSAMEKK